MYFCAKLYPYMRKIIILSGIILLVLAIGFAGIKYYQSQNKKPVIQTFSTKQNPAFKAVPLKSPLIIEVKNQEGFFNALKGDKEVLSELKGIPEVENLFSNVSRFRSFAESRSGIRDLLNTKSIIISVNPSGKNQLSNLYLVQMNNAQESGSVTSVVSSQLGSEFSITRRNYGDTQIFSAKSDKTSFYFACTNDIFMASEDFILVEDAIRQSNSQSLLNNREFTAVYKTIEETALANIFINHLTIHQILAKLVAPEIRKNLSRLTAYSNWSELDLSSNAAEISLEGFSVTRDSTDTYLNVFRNQEPEKLTITEAIPSSASYFIALNLKNTRTYLDQYEAFLRAKGNFYPREMKLIDFRKKTGTDPAALIKEVGGTQFAGVFTNINKSNPEQNRFFVAELNDKSVAKEKLQKAVSEYSATSKTVGEKLKTSYTAGKNSLDIYQLPIGSMGESLFGSAFSGISAGYFTIYDRYLICGDNLPGMKNYLQNLAQEKTMDKDSAYLAFTRKAMPNPNLYVYAKIPKIIRLKDVLLRPEISASASQSEDIIRKYSFFSWQLSTSGSMVKNRIAIKYDPLAKEEPQTVWQLKLEGQLAQAPKFVLNHKDLANREIIVCDRKNNVSLINKEGLVLWTMNIPDEIISEIHQIDLYRNNKFQYIFNTKNQLYIIDRMGNKVGKYPVALKSVATNGVAVIELGKNKEYRFVVAGADRKIYAFDRDGRPVQKWNTTETDATVTRPIEYHEVGGKDFFIASDNQKIYFIDRQGKLRDVQPAAFAQSSNPFYFVNDGNPHLIASDQSGKIHVIDFSGEAEIKEIGRFGAGHHFVAADIDGNGSVEYLFAEGKKLSVFANDGKKLFEKAFPETISELPQIGKMGGNAGKIGIVVGSENKIYLLEPNGSVTKGFPLDGNSGFALGKFNDSNSWFNLITGSEGNSLDDYRIE